MDLKELVSIGGKTTMRIGGQARFYGEMQTKEDVEQAYAAAREKGLPLIVLGGGSNTVFTDGIVEAVVVRMKAAETTVDGNSVTVKGGVILGSLINDLAQRDLDLSALTGIPGTVGGAIVGNAGQGPKGTWIDTFVRSVTCYADGIWQTFAKDQCGFAYRESDFKHRASPAIIWEATLEVPSKPAADVKAEVERLIQKRIETQPHLRTAGSCFKAVGATPAWQLLDAAGLRGRKFGGVEIAQKHANFLLNDGTATYADAVSAVEAARTAVPHDLEVEMRFIEPDGSLRY